MTIAIIISLVVGLFGLYMVNKVGNYETVWGFLMVAGAVLTVFLTIISVGMFLVV